VAEDTKKNTGNVTQLFPAPDPEPRKPTLKDIVEMYEFGSMTADEAVMHISNHGYFSQVFMNLVLLHKQKLGLK
jgi:hypothetical protein